MIRKNTFLLRLALLSLGALLMTAAFSIHALPLADAGAFPTLTPTATPPPPTHPPTNVPEATATEAPTSAPESVGPDQAVIEAFTLPTATATPFEIPEPSTGNPLMPLVYIGLFILLVVGIWFLFSRRGMGP